MTLRSSAGLTRYPPRNVVRHLVFIGRMSGAAISDERIHFAFAAELNPFTLGREAARTRALRRVAKSLPHARWTASLQLVSRERMRPESPSRSLIKRCFLRSLFLFLEILSLGKSSRMPLAALQIAFSILFHLVPPSAYHWESSGEAVHINR